MVIMGDVRPNRLEAARKLGAIGIDLNEVRNDEALRAELKKYAGRDEVDCSIECVGYECCGIGSQANVNIAESALNTCFSLTKAGGHVGIPGVYLPADPSGASPNLRNGVFPLSFGLVWQKALELKMGQCPVMYFNAGLLETIIRNRISVAEAMNIQIIPLSEAPMAYKKFADGEHVKYILDPHGTLSSIPTGTGTGAGSISRTHGKDAMAA